MKQLPQRTCMGCNSKKNKNDLIRIVKDKNGTISVDKTGRLSGRGAYLCNDIACLERVIKSKRLERVLETHISNDVYESLRNTIVEQ